MARARPTPADLKVRYPEFTAVSNERVAVFIEDAVSYVGEDWDDVDWKMGILAGAAHLMSKEGEPRANGGTAPISVTKMSGVKRRKVGDVETEYGGSSSSSSGGANSTALSQDLSGTPYGQVLMRLIHMNGMGAWTV